MSTPSGTTIGVLGLGLMGGSCALAAQRAATPVVCWDSDADTRRRAAAAGLRVTSDFSEVGVAVLAVPMPSLTTGLADTLAGVRLSQSVTITDVGSLKLPVLDAMASNGLSARYIGGHPMAGTEQSGFGAANPDLPRGARWALCLTGDEPDLTRWLRVAEVITKLGAGVLALTPAEHDRAMATVSGLPHLLALGLAASAAQAGPLVAALAAGSFADITRVAASDPRLLHAVIQENEAALRMALRRLLDQLDRPWTDLITDGSTAKTDLAVGASGAGYSEERDAVVSGPAEVLELGRMGAVIVAVEAATGALRYRKPGTP